MRSQLLVGVGLALALATNSVAAQDLIWRPARESVAAPAVPVTLGRPQPLYVPRATPTPSPEETKERARPGVVVPPLVSLDNNSGSVLPASLEQPRPIFRGQSPDLPAVTVPPPPPPPGGFGGPAVFPGGPAAAPIRGGPNAEAYNCGLAA